MVQKDDVLIVLSKSGVSDEILIVLPSLRAIGVPIIAITCEVESKLAFASRESNGVVLLIHCDEEACPHDLAPTASTTAMLVLGDALAIALLEARNFSSLDFARLHPAGALGRKPPLPGGPGRSGGPPGPALPVSAFGAAVPNRPFP